MAGRTSARIAVLGLLALATALGGCNSLSALNPFGERDRPLPGKRIPVFEPGDPNAGPQRATPPDRHASSPRAVAEPSTGEDTN